VGLLTPTFEGVLEEKDLPADILDRVARRVQTGGFPSAGGRRQNYEVSTSEEVGVSERALGYREAEDTRRLRIVAKDWATRLAIGLNDVELTLEPGGRLSYRVSYREWTRFPMWMAIGFSSLTALVGLIIYVSGAPTGPVHTGGWVGIGSGLFWGGVWPWLLMGILVSAHKKIAQRVLVQFLGQVASESRETGDGELHVALRERANAVLAVLGSRGVTVEAEERDRILRCSDPALLEQWLARAAVASAMTDVFAEPRPRVATGERAPELGSLGEAVERLDGLLQDHGELRDQKEREALEEREAEELAAPTMRRPGEPR
jgi:hypothetical protein